MKKLAILFVLAALAIQSQAQDYHWRLTYDVSIPLGTMSEDFISKTSWRGIGVDNRWEVSNKLSVGFYASWHVFYERKDNVLAMNEDETFAAYGNQFRYLNTWIFQANAHYYLGEQGQINPWVGIGIGTAINNERTELGFLALVYDPWSFSVSPQVGIDIPLNISTDFTLGVRYNYLMNSENKARFDYTYLGINAGFKFLVF